MRYIDLLAKPKITIPVFWMLWGAFWGGECLEEFIKTGNILALVFSALNAVLFFIWYDTLRSAIND